MPTLFFDGDMFNFLSITGQLFIEPASDGSTLP